MQQRRGRSGTNNPTASQEEQNSPVADEDFELGETMMGTTSSQRPFSPTSMAAAPVINVSQSTSRPLTLICQSIRIKSIFWRHNSIRSSSRRKKCRRSIRIFRKTPKTISKSTSAWRKEETFWNQSSEQWSGSTGNPRSF